MPDFVLTATQARRLLRYEPKTRFLFWKKKRQGPATDNLRAGSLRPDGSRNVSIKGCSYMEHRIAWLIHFGEWPEGVIDHKNGDPSDNRIRNLRDVSRSENSQNQRKAQSSNKSTGLLGVTLRRPGVWAARISVGGKNLHLGQFDSPISAHEAYLTAKRNRHGGCLI